MAKKAKKEISGIGAIDLAPILRGEKLKVLFKYWRSYEVLQSR